MRGSKAIERADLGALLVLGAMVLWFGHEMVWGGKVRSKVPFFRDLGILFYPMRLSLARSFMAGELPLWDRHVAMGFPLMANLQSGTFYPPHILFFFLPFFGAVLVAAAGGYCLWRRWGYSPFLALLGAILFTFGGYIVSLTNLLTSFQAGVWFPWVLISWERHLRSRSWQGFLLLTSVLLVQFLAGMPEIYGMSMGLLFLDGWRLRSAHGSITCRHVFLSLLGTNALVVGLAFVQILPTLELVFQSRALHTISYAQAVHWSLHPLNLFNLFFMDREVVPGSINGLRLFFTARSQAGITTTIFGFWSVYCKVRGLPAG